MVFGKAHAPNCDHSVFGIIGNRQFGCLNFGFSLFDNFLHVYENMLAATIGSTILQIDTKPLYSKISCFRPLIGSDKASVCVFVRFCRSLVRSVCLSPLKAPRFGTQKTMQKRERNSGGPKQENEGPELQSARAGAIETPFFSSSLGSKTVVFFLQFQKHFLYFWHRNRSKRHQEPSMTATSWRAYVFFCSGSVFGSLFPTL